MDRAPTGKTFGDVLQPLEPKYRVVRLTKRSWNSSEACVWGWGEKCLMSPLASNHAIDQLLAMIILTIVLNSAESLQT